MSTPKAAASEIAEISTAYQYAVAQLGVAMVADAIDLWQSYPVTQSAKSSSRWLAQITALVLQWRRQSVALGRAYYRLARALATGKTTNDTTRDEGTHVTLGELRKQFHDLAHAADSHKPKEHADDDRSIPVQIVRDLERLERQAEDAAKEEIRVVMQALGPANLERKVRQIDTGRPASEVDKERQKAHDEAGARHAAAAGRIAMNGARSETWLTQESDKAAIGWVRVSTTGTPCGWCAMLISRGPVYRSQKSASATYEDGDKYHDNDKCVALPVFSRDWYAQSPLFNLNREYADLWPKVTKGLGGEDALSAWRRFFRTQQAAQARRAA